MKLVALLFGFVVGASAGLAFGVVHWRSAIMPFYPATRGHYVKSLVAQSGEVDTLVIGDSISEMTMLDGACGRTFNASVGGSTIPLQLEIARAAKAKMKPKTIIVETGRNYFHDGPNPQFQKDYRVLLDALAGHRLILVGIPLVPDETDFVKRTAKQIGAEFVMPATGELTLDGVHPTHRGASVYRDRLMTACATT